VDAQEAQDPFMLVLVVGNINSGKSHAVRLIQAILPEYPVLAIDEYRKKFGDGTIESELETRKRFVEDVACSTDAIVELSGMGPLGTMLESAIPPKRFVVVHIDEDVNVCLERVALKDFASIPYPKFEETLENTIRRINQEVHSGQLKKLWKAKNLAFFTIENNVNLKNEIEAIPFRLYEKTILVLTRLMDMKEIREIVVYGSLARKELSIHSDVDMMVTTDLSLRELEEELSMLPGLSFHDTPDGKVTLYFDNWLVEVVVVPRLEENAKYYVNSYIEDIKGSILKGNDDTLLTLMSMQENFHPNVECLRQETLKRLNFFLKSLPGIAKKYDAYKYFFHTNIIIHELVRLERIVQNDLHYLYLPKQVASTTAISLQRLAYTFEQEFEQHQRCLSEEVLRVFQSLGLSSELDAMNYYASIKQRN
jgi:predicted nucleotidyltransferase